MDFDRFHKKSTLWAFSISTGIFTFVPETFFKGFTLITEETLKNSSVLSTLDPDAINITFARIIFLVFILGIVSIIYVFFLNLRRWVTIEGRNYLIRVEYGDILKTKNCKRVIAFDECFTAKVGTAIEDINKTSICGQYIDSFENFDITPLIEKANVTPMRSKSKYTQKNMLSFRNYSTERR